MRNGCHQHGLVLELHNQDLLVKQSIFMFLSLKCGAKTLSAQYPPLPKTLGNVVLKALWSKGQKSSGVPLLRRFLHAVLSGSVLVDLIDRLNINLPQMSHGQQVASHGLFCRGSMR